MTIPEILIATAVPGLLAPLIAWYLSQRGISRRAKELGGLLTRVELLERLRGIQRGSDSEAAFQEVIDAEVGDIIHDLESLREMQASVAAVRPKGVPAWRRFLLMYKQVSLKGKIYKGVFYSCLFLGLMAGFTLSLINGTTEGVASQSATSQSATSQSATSQSATSQSATSQSATSQSATSQSATSQSATSQSAEAPSLDIPWYVGVLYGAFYLVVGLFFRAAAVRNYERVTKKLATPEPS